MTVQQCPAQSLSSALCRPISSKAASISPLPFDNAAACNPPVSANAGCSARGKCGQGMNITRRHSKVVNLNAGTILLHESMAALATYATTGTHKAIARQPPSLEIDAAMLIPPALHSKDRFPKCECPLKSALVRITPSAKQQSRSLFPLMPWSPHRTAPIRRHRRIFLPVLHQNGQRFFRGSLSVDALRARARLTRRMLNARNSSMVKQPRAR